MPKFRFTLEAVLRHRTLAEQERQREFALAQGEMERLRSELTALNDALRAEARDMKDNHLTGTLDVKYLAAHRRYTVATQRKGQQLVQEMARQQRKVDEAQRVLAEAAKERKIIEKLKERQHGRWKAELSAKEVAETDEVGAQWGYRQQLETLRAATDATGAQGPGAAAPAPRPPFADGGPTGVSPAGGNVPFFPGA